MEGVVVFNRKDNDFFLLWNCYVHGPKVSYEKKIEIFGTYGDIEKSAIVAADVRVGIQDFYVQMHGIFEIIRHIKLKHLEVQLKFEFERRL